MKSADEINWATISLRDLDLYLNYCQSFRIMIKDWPRILKHHPTVSKLYDVERSFADLPIEEWHYFNCISWFCYLDTIKGES